MASATKMWSVDVKEPLGPQLEEAATLLAANEVVAFPTETVYGLGGNAWSDAAVSRIFAAKGRPADNPLIVHIASAAQLKDLVEHVPPVAERLAKAFWPGPLTMIFKKRGPISGRVTAGLDSVAVRIPSHPVALALLEKCQLPIAAPSANLSGKPSPTTAQHVQRDLSGRVAGIVDGGPTGVGLESTVVDCSAFPPDVDVFASPSSAAPAPSDSKEQQQQPQLYILRPGGVTKEDLEAVVGAGRVALDPHLWGGGPPERAMSPADGPSELPSPAGAGGEAAARIEEYRPRAPGMKYLHYAPRAPVRLVYGSDAFLQRLIDAAAASSQRVGVLTTEEKRDRFRNAHSVQLCGRRADLASVAQRLYDCLRAFDETEVDVIYAEAFPQTGIGHAVMNRLEKAAGSQVDREEDGEGSER